MAEGGRILHHLARYAPDPKNDILFMGHQVTGTLGHKLINGAFDFDYFGKIIPVEASVEQIDAFSAHADQQELLDWLAHLGNKPQILLNHGNKEALENFKKKISEKLDFPTKILAQQEEIELK